MHLDIFLAAAQLGTTGRDFPRRLLGSRFFFAVTAHAYRYVNADATVSVGYSNPQVRIEFPAEGCPARAISARGSNSTCVGPASIARSSLRPPWRPASAILLRLTPLLQTQLVAGLDCSCPRKTGHNFSG